MTQTTEWFRLVADIMICRKCWAPVAIISDDAAGNGRYDYDARLTHQCPDMTR